MSAIYDSISKTSKTLMFKEQFWGLFLISMNKDLSNRIGTACVSKQGINVQLTVNPEFWAKLSEPTKVGVLKHELLHVGLDHLSMCDRYPDKQLFNIAADIEINQYVGKEWKGSDWMGLELVNYPELKMKEKAGTKMYYDMLDQINQNRMKMPHFKQCIGQGAGSQQQGEGEGEGDGQGQGSGQGNGKSGNGDYKSPNDGSSAEKSKLWDVYDAMKAGQKSIYSHDLWKEFYEGLSESEKKIIKKQIEYQLKRISEEVQKSRGTIPGELKGIIDALYKVEEPVIDWKQYLRRYGCNSNKVYTKKSRNKLNKRFAENPAIRIKYKKHILVARDTSGSVGQNDHIEFFNELHHIYKTGVKITILDADAGCHDVFEYKGKAPDHISGMGGTDFDPAIEYYNEHYKQYDSFIYLTDGECPAPKTKPRTQMLWVISSGGTLNYTEGYPGKIVQITR